MRTEFFWSITYRVVVIRYRRFVTTYLPHLQWSRKTGFLTFNPLNAELNPICHLLALAGAHHFVHVSRVRVKDGMDRMYRNVRKELPLLDA